MTYQTYTAVHGLTGHPLSIISVGAESLAEAHAEIKRQLSKPGRATVLSAWVDDGSFMVLNRQFDHKIRIINRDEIQVQAARENYQAIIERLDNDLPRHITPVVTSHNPNNTGWVIIVCHCSPKG